MVGLVQRGAPLPKLQLRKSQPEMGNTVGGLQIERRVKVVNRGLCILQIIEDVPTVYVSLHHLRIACEGFGVVLHRLL